MKLELNYKKHTWTNSTFHKLIDLNLWTVFISLTTAVLYVLTAETASIGHKRASISRSVLVTLFWISCSKTSRDRTPTCDRSTFTVTNHAVSLFEGILNTVSVSPEYFLVRYKASKRVRFNKSTFFKPNTQYLKLFWKHFWKIKLCNKPWFKICEA